MLKGFEKFNESDNYNFVNNLIYNKITDELKGLDKLIEIIEDCLIDVKNISIDHQINKDSYIGDHLDTFIPSIKFSIRINSLRLNRPIGRNPYSNVSIDINRVNECIDEQIGITKEFLNFLKIFHSMVYRLDKSGYKMNYYSPHTVSNFSVFSFSFIVENKD